MDDLTLNDAKARINTALDIANRFASDDGCHHKMWVIDQMVRTLTGPDYKEWIRIYKMGEDGPETNEWGEGVAP